MKTDWGYEEVRAGRKAKPQTRKRWGFQEAKEVCEELPRPPEAGT